MSILRRTSWVAMVALSVISIGAAAAATARAEPDWKIGGKFLKSGEERVGRTTGGEIDFDAGVRCTFKDINLLLDGSDEQRFLSYRCTDIDTGCMVERPIPRARVTRLKARGGKFYDLEEDVEISIPVINSECVVTGEKIITGNLEGEWNNATSTLEFPETPLEGSTLKEGSESVTISGEDEYRLEGCGGTLEVGEADPKAPALLRSGAFSSQAVITLLGPSQALEIL